MKMDKEEAQDVLDALNRGDYDFARMLLHEIIDNPEPSLQDLKLESKDLLKQGEDLLERSKDINKKVKDSLGRLNDLKNMVDIRNHRESIKNDLILELLHIIMFHLLVLTDNSIE
jgi:hypothetical protein